MPTFLKLIGIGLLMSVIGLFLVQRDVRLRLWGQTTGITLAEAYIAKTGRLGTREKLKVEYSFRDGKDQLFKGTFTPSDSWDPGAEAPKVLYLPNDPTIHRLTVEGGSGSYVVFLLGILFLALGVWRFFKESVTDSHKSETPMNAKGKVGRIMDKLAD